MNYLKKQSDLVEAMRAKYGTKQKKKFESELGRLHVLIKEMNDINTGRLTDAVDSRVNGKKTKKRFTPEECIAACMNTINKICDEYGVEHMFPSTGWRSKKDAIQVFNEYMEQVRAEDRLMKEAGEEWKKTKDDEEFKRKQEYYTDHIEEIIAEEKGKEDGQETDDEEEISDIPDLDEALYGPEIVPTNYIINMNDRCKDLEGTMFRDQVIRQTLSCLIGRSKPNALLIGAAGVGKTRIVEDLAAKLANDDPVIPDMLKGYTIWEFPISNIVSGSALVGDLERKLNKVLDFARDPENKVILFIDEIHVLVSGMQTYDKIAQIMKPALSRGDLKVIGATTLQEGQSFMRDPAFNRRFTKLIVDELSREQTTELLKKEAGKLMDHYGGLVSVDEDQIPDIVAIADEYRTMGNHRPDNAITLLDIAMADAVIDRTSKAKKGTRTRRRTIRLDIDRIRKTAMRLMTGNNEKTAVDIKLLKKKLSVIKGQDDAVEYLIDAIRRDSISAFSRERPLTFLFAGSSGVGKTEVTKIIAEAITGVKPIILNMTEFTSSADITRITGSPAGYIGSDSKAELPFDMLESNPYQVILLDEFEKCDKAIQRLFMSAFDEGYFKTAKGKAVDFSKSIIVATTNAGDVNKGKNRIGFSFSTDDSDETSVVELAEYYDVELLNRFTKILNFHPIGKDCYKEIMRDTYRREVERIKNSMVGEYDFLEDELPNDAVEELTKESYNPKFGARPVARTVQKYIEDRILERK